MTQIVAEIGINHNGCIDAAREMIVCASEVGADYVKFQKRTLPECVPPEQREQLRDTPWGRMTYLDYRRRVEFGEREYAEIDRVCTLRGIGWAASAWDVGAVEFLAARRLAYLKIPSAKLTDRPLLEAAARAPLPVVLSTGMSTAAEIDAAVGTLGTHGLTLLVCTSCYPCPAGELHLARMDTLRARYKCPVGYSGHEQGWLPSLAAVALGAVQIERHFTLDRRAWGSDQAASLEPGELRQLVGGVRTIKAALGRAELGPRPCEQAARERLRGKEQPCVLQ